MRMRKKNYQILVKMLLQSREETDLLTVSGWVMNKLGSIPVVGDEFEYNGIEISVLAMDGNRIEKVCVLMPTANEE